MVDSIIFGKTIRVVKLYFRNDRKVFKALPKEVALVTRRRRKRDGTDWEEVQSIVVYPYYDKEKKEYVLPEIIRGPIKGSNTMEIKLTHLPQEG